MTCIMFVKIKTDLDASEVEKRIADRTQSFREVAGLQQKIFGRDPQTGEVCGIYIFADSESLNKYRASELAKSIPVAYEALEVRRESFELLQTLYPLR